MIWSLYPLTTEDDILEENIIAILRLPQTIYQKILIIIEFFIKYGLGTKTYLGLYPTQYPCKGSP